MVLYYLFSYLVTVILAHVLACGNNFTSDCGYETGEASHNSGLEHMHISTTAENQQIDQNL
jgi:hypothetical protein